MNANKRFEIKAEAFFNMTGMMAPGKMKPISRNDAGLYGARDFEEREKKWEGWMHHYGDVANAIISAYEKIEKESD